jgi:hypothetical protein
MSRVTVRKTEGGDYRVTATRGEYAVQVRYQPTGQAMVPSADYVVCADGTRDGVYGWHQIGRIGSDSTEALRAALRSGLLDDLRTIAPDLPPIDHDKQVAEAAA